MSTLQGLRTRLPAQASGEAAAIEGLLVARLAVARARWPAIKLGDAEFLDHLWPPDAKRPAAPADAASLAALHLEDLFLACACARGDRAALAALERSVLARVPRWVARFADVHGEEVQQELRQKLLLPPEPLLLDYTGRGALDRWARVAASRCAIDRQRRVKPIDDGDPIEQLLSGPNPELDFVKLHDRETLRSVLRDAFGALAAPSRALLRLHYLESVTLEKLAALERVHPATIKRRLAEARAEALVLVRKLIRERLKLTDSEGASLLRLVESRLALSLRGAG